MTLNLTGQTFGRLTVLSRNIERGAQQSKSTRYVYWNCRCVCDTEVVVATKSLTSGNTKSCGCFRREVTAKQVATKAGVPVGMVMRDIPEYQLFKNVKRRCVNPKATQFKDYGGRGIKFKFGSPTEATLWVLKHLGPRPEGHSLDRIDNDGHYESGNLRWATKAVQNENRRPRKRIDQFTDEELWAELERRVPCLTSRCQ